jgi:hypothetical protein
MRLVALANVVPHLTAVAEIEQIKKRRRFSTPSETPRHVVLNCSRMQRETDRNYAKTRNRRERTTRTLLPSQRRKDDDNNDAYSATKTAAAPIPRPAREREEGQHGGEEEGEGREANEPMHIEVTRILPPRRLISLRPVAT